MSNINIKIRTKNNLKESIINLQKALKEDEEYYYGWKSNIAMAFFDEYNNATDKITINLPHDQILKIANNAAERFLQQLIL